MEISSDAIPNPLPGQRSPLYGLSVFGAGQEYGPQMRVLVSQLAWMRKCALMRIHALSRENLDWLPSPDGNTIGALLLHLAAVETYYQFHTFDDLPWPTTSPETRKRFGPAMKLGDLGRRIVKGHDLSFYLDALKEVRERTLSGFEKRDDDWLMAVDENWFWGPTNNLCKWFHVCEHESHHLGQIEIHLKSIRSRQASAPSLSEEPIKFGFQ